MIAYRTPSNSGKYSLLVNMVTSGGEMTVRYYALDNDRMLLIRFDIGRQVAFRERPGSETSRLPTDQSGGGVSGGVGQYVTQLGAIWKTHRTPSPNQWLSTLSEN